MSKVSVEDAVVKGGGHYLHPDFVTKHSEVLKRIGRELRLPNPEYRQAMALRDRGKYVELPDQWVLAIQRLPIAHPWGNGLQIPRAVKLNIHGAKTYDKTSFPPGEKLSLAEHIELRDYQNHSIANFKHETQGVVIAPCGAGKTTIGIGAIAAIDTPALILVHTLDLARQWADRVKQQLNFEASIVGGGTNDLEKGKSNRVVIATFQTICRWMWSERYDFAKQFGLLIVDECHHVPANTFCEALMTMPQKYRLGLTATPERPDGLTNLLHWHMGKVLFEITTQDLVNRGLVSRPVIRQVRTGWSIPGDERPEWTTIVSQMCGDDHRTQFILDQVDILVRNEGRQVLVLSDRVAHCEQMAEELRGEGLRASALVGKVSKTKRAKILAAADKREIDVIFATCLADEGLDLPGLDTVFLTVPTKALGRVQQRIGRIMRVREGKKTPVVYDLIDNEPFFLAMANKRAKLYRSLGCEFEERK